jgi:hypothetical protein
MTGWQHIETAPKDGSDILFGRALPWRSPTGNVCVGFWHVGQNEPGWQAQDGGRLLPEHWPYWQPLPAEPVNK